jgi:predicted RNA-binding Zn-ribbon protein involved in translation (DUF1610 family)
MDAVKKPTTIISVVCEHCGKKMKVRCDETRTAGHSERIVCLNPECKREFSPSLPGAFMDGPFLE